MIDTHVWLWWIGRIRLSSAVQKALDEMEERPLLSVISLWELSLLVQSDRIELAPSPQEWVRTALHPGAVRLAHLTREVGEALLGIPNSFHRDPADRIIVATARALHIPVLTYDRTIRHSGLVEPYRPGRR